MNNSQTSAREKKEIYEQNQIELNKRKGELQQKYGIIFHKEMVALIDFQQELHQEQINIMRQEFEEQVNQTNETNQEIINQWKLLYQQGEVQKQANNNDYREAITTIEKASKPFQTENAWAGFSYGFGKYGLWALFVFGLAYFVYDIQYNTKEYQEIKTYVSNFKDIEKYGQLCKYGKIVKNPEDLKGSFLKLTMPEPQKRNTIGENYFLSEDKKCIYVPLLWE